jgi:hypothetical protein
VKKTTKRAERQKRIAAKRSGVLPDLAAAAEPLSIYAGNSARMDEARDAYERAEAWAQSPAGTPYGGRRVVQRNREAKR